MAALGDKANAIAVLVFLVGKSVGGKSVGGEPV